MKIKLTKNHIIKNQTIVIDKPVNIIYGFNNSGKTSILKAIQEQMMTSVRSNLYEELNMFNYIPTNRTIKSVATHLKSELNDNESFFLYLYSKYKNYDEHLSIINKELLNIKVIYNFVYNGVKEIFPEVENINEENYDKLSDGIKNILNIFLEIIWVILCKIKLEKKNDFLMEKINEKEFESYIDNTNALILIDEIEMFLHVSLQEKFINKIREKFKKCIFIVTTHSPLILARTLECDIFEIIDGKLDKINKNLYYQDLDYLFYSNFNVAEEPNDLKEDISYLYQAIDGKIEIEIKRVDEISERLKKYSEGLYKRYYEKIIYVKEKKINASNEKNK